MLQTISSQLCEPIPFINPVVKILLTVTISRDGFYAFSKYSSEKGDFITVNPSTHITIRYTPKGIPWEKHHQITITQRNMFQLRMGFKRFYRNFQRDDLYLYDEFGRIKEMVADSRDNVSIGMGFGQQLGLSPAIITDKKGIRYPGVSMLINKVENEVDLTIEEFEGLYDLFTTINIYQSGLTLLQTYIGMRKTPVESTMEQVEKQRPPKTEYKNLGNSMFERNKEIVKGPPESHKPMTLDDL